MNLDVHGLTRNESGEGEGSHSLSLSYNRAGLLGDKPISVEMEFQG